jgi:hypothetical protein
MSGRTNTISAALKWPSIVIGSILIGCAMVDPSFLLWPTMLGALILLAIAIVAYGWESHSIQHSGEDPKSFERQRSHIDGTDLLCQNSVSAHDVAVGSGVYSHMREPIVVESLIAVLDKSKEIHEPGWDEVWESIVGTIAGTGDARWLPVLGRVRLARGLAFRDAVDAAIAAIICKQSDESGRMESGVS